MALGRICRFPKAWWLCVVLTGIVSAAAAAEPPPFLGGFLTESRAVYPLKVGHWEAVDEHRYDDPAYGVSVRYRDSREPDRWLDVYFYPAGVVNEDALRQGVEQTREGIAQMGRQSQTYDSVDVGDLKRIVLHTGQGDGRRDLPTYLVPISLSAKGQAYHSVMGLLVLDMYFVKLRYSAPADEIGQWRMNSQSRRFLRELVRTGEVLSTGACWDPLPIIKRAHLDEHAEGMLMSNSVDGQLASVAFSDRVEATDPADPASLLMQVMASLTTGRIADPSCVAPENINPQVGDGMREIRMEYRTPSDDDTHGESGGVGRNQVSVRQG